MLKRIRTLVTHRIYNLPILLLMPHSRCNCRCIMCDIWKANHDKRELPVSFFEDKLDYFRQLGVREVVFSGGEALMHANFWKLCEQLKLLNAKLTLLSTGLLLSAHAEKVVEHIDNVIVSLDGSEPVHNQIRNVPDAYGRLSNGVAALRKIKTGYVVTARCVLQRLNFRDLPNIIQAAHDLQLNQISFLASDVSSTAFNHEQWTPEKRNGIALSAEEAMEFEKIVLASFTSHARDYETKFIAEPELKMLKLVQYFKALHGLADFPEVSCNAPWVSAVIESNGDVMPCFFHRPYGNLFENKLEDIINSPQAVDFRKNLDTTKDKVCARCVCSLKLGISRML